MNRKWALGLLGAALVCGVVLASTFHEQRVKFREEINLKVEEPMTKDGLINSDTFKNEKPWNFKVSPEETAKLKPLLGDYFAVKDDKLLDRMVGDMNNGRFIVYKEFNKNSDGVNLKCAFLSPKVPYWKALSDIGGIEKLFYVYNYSIVLGNKTPAETVVLLQTEGKYLGFGKSVTLPEYFRADEPNKTLYFRIATQAEAVDAANKLPTLKTGRTSLQDRFLDLCRTDPWYQEKDSSGNYAIPDKDILDVLDKDITHKDTKCDVYASDGRWKVQEDISNSYLLVTYSLKTQVNIQAFIPPSIPFLGSMFKKVAQQVSDEVSAKYMPLSMKNFRDHTVEWAQTTH